MKTKLEQLRKDKAALLAQLQELAVAEQTPENVKAFDEATAKVEAINGQIERIERVIKEQNDLASRSRVVMPEAMRETTTLLPATPRMLGKLRNFHGPQAHERAIAATHWFAAISGNAKATDWCGQNNYPLMKAVGQREGSNIAGGYLVPEQLASDIIELMVDYGVFRQHAKIRPMTTDTIKINRRTGGLVAYPRAETAAAKVSTKGWDQVSLNTKSWDVLAITSQELISDAVINIVDDLMGEIARAFAYAEDYAGFNANGESAYAGIRGVNAALYAAAGNPTTTSAGGIIVGAGDTYAELVIANFSLVAGLLPTYARRNAKWFCSPTFKSQVMDRLLMALGANTIVDIQNGAVVPKFCGYPVVETEAMPSVGAATQVCALFGDLSLAAALGDRQEIEIATSTDATIDGISMFQTKQLAVMGSERFDITVHDVGSATAAGPIVGLLTLNT